MGNLTITEIGSVILNMIEDVSDNISGTLPTIISNEIYFAEEFTGDNIGTSVGDRYQPAIFALSESQVLRLMELEGADVSSIRLGDFNINKGGNSSTDVSASALRTDGIEKLEELGRLVSHYRTY